MSHDVSLPWMERSMNYVISDVHGCYDLFLRMLDKICFSPEDTLFLLGDAADRGQDGVPLLLDVLQRKNVVMLLGNHEDMFRRVIRCWDNRPSVWESQEAKRLFLNWTERNGGDVTWRSYLALPKEKQDLIREFLAGLPLYRELQVHGRRFLLVHAGVGKNPTDSCLDDCSPMDLLWTRMDYEKVYYADRFLVTGHTPTVLIDPEYKEKIFRKNNHIAVDCGAVFFGTLGCFCLDTLEEIYVS